jgi:hypothetical protein
VRRGEPVGVEQAAAFRSSIVRRSPSGEHQTPPSGETTYQW